MVRLASRAIPRAALALLLVAVLATLGVAAVSAAGPSSVTVKAANTSLGMVLVGPNGHTLYTLSSDPNNGSSCSGQCAVAWPPLLAGSASGPGINGSFTTFARSDGSTQVAFNARALYYFINDSAAGQTNGEGIVSFGGTWHVVKVSAAVASASPSAMSSAMASSAPSASASSIVLGVTSQPGTSLAPTTTGGTRPGGADSTLPLLMLAIAAIAAAVTFVTIRSRVPRR